MTDVEAGGATVFPRIDIRVLPKKVSLFPNIDTIVLPKNVHVSCVLLDRYFHVENVIFMIKYYS
jgi:hypothetical protein